MTSTPPMAPAAMAASRHAEASTPALPAASIGIAASSGIAAMSWNSRMANALRPIGVAVRLRSPIVCIAIAVDDSASASPATSAAFHGMPTASPPAASAAPDSASCSVPPPKTARRIACRRFVSSSSPITNSISTTPNSEKCRIDSTSSTNPSPQGPIAAPAIR